MNLKRLGPLIGLILLFVALWVVHNELRLYHLKDIIQQLRLISAGSLSQAIALTILSYLIMTGYDFLALQYIRKPLRYAKTALASFIGYAFSNTIGLSMLAGATVRYRLYSAWGLNALEITKVILFCTLTLWLGFLSLGGIVFIFTPPAIPAVLNLPVSSAIGLGVLFLIPVGAYFVLASVRREPFRFKGFELELPSQKLSLPQMLIALADWCLAGAVLYVLLPASPALTYFAFMGVYLLAQMAGLASQVPGGLGVFEAMLMLMLGPVFSPPPVLGALLIYRVIYYILPLTFAAVLLGVQELIHRSDFIKDSVRVIGQWLPAVIPSILAVTTFTGGILLLFSGAIPVASPRLIWLKDIIPLPLLELSHFLGSIVGVMLLLLARGLQRRLDGAYLITMVLLMAGAAFSLLRGLEYEIAIMLTILALVLWPSHPFFYRKASLTSEFISAQWFAAALLVFCSSVWLIWFSYRHIEYSHSLWWRFSFDHDAPRSLRAMVGTFAVLFWFGLARLFRPARVSHPPAQEDDLARAMPLIQLSPDGYANLALLGDKTLLFSEEGNAFLMYRIEGRSWIVMGDPIGETSEWPELVWQFVALCDEHAGWPVFYEVGAPNLPLYLDLGLTVLKLGEEARIDLNAFGLEGSSRKELRYIHNRMEKTGLHFEIIPPENVSAMLPEMRTVSDAWLKGKHTSEKGFSLGFFQDEFLKHFPIATVRSEWVLLAFATLWLGADRHEISVDIMRHSDDAPPGIMDYLFIKLMLWGKQEGYHWFNIGMAPLSGIENRPFTPLWNRLGAFLYGHGEYFYNFQGIRQYKDKFQPEWRPKYLVSPGGLALPQILTNLTALIAGGLKGVLAK